MKNLLAIFAIIIVITLIGFGGYSLAQKSSSSNSMMEKEEASVPQAESDMKPEGEMMKQDDNSMGDKAMMDDEQSSSANKMTGSRYVQYSKSVFDSVSSNRRVLFFYASWCPTCKPADASFTQNSNKIPENTTVIRVNYNDPETDQSEKDLAKKYGITYQHTFVQLDTTGKEITKWNGGQIDELLSRIK